MDLVVHTDHLPRAGETVMGGELEYRARGKGANQAVASRRLGVKSYIAGCVGRDQFGSDLRRSLTAAGVDISAVYEVGDVTGIALIIVGPGSEKVIAVSPGTNAHPNGDGPAVTAQSLLDTADVLLLQLETPIATATTAARLAQAARVPVLFNAAPAPTVVNEDLLQLIALADILVVNQTEAAGLAAGLNHHHAAGPMQFAKLLRGLGPADVVVTCGADGALLATGGGVARRIPGFRVSAVDAVGAGDAFCAELGVACAMRLPDRAAAVERACAAGALTASRSSGQGGFPTRVEVDALVAAGPRARLTGGQGAEEPM